MTFLESYGTKRRERIARLNIRSPDALPPRRKPPVSIIKLDRRGRRVMPPPPPIVRDVLFVATTAPLIPRKLRSRKATIADIYRVVAAAHSIPLIVLRARSRANHIAHARQIVMYLAHNNVGLSYPEVGRAMGYDHSTVLYGCRKVGKRMADDLGMAALVEQIQHEVTELFDAQA